MNMYDDTAAGRRDDDAARLPLLLYLSVMEAARVRVRWCALPLLLADIVRWQSCAIMTPRHRFVSLPVVLVPYEYRDAVGRVAEGRIALQLKSSELMSDDFYNINLKFERQCIFIPY